MARAMKNNREQSKKEAFLLKNRRSIFKQMAFLF